jgi:LysR family transcriptional activator of nhaA
MEWLNYNHFLYFWTVARTGSVLEAARELMLSASTVSAQVHALEQSLGSPLFRRKGRSLVLTEVGQLAYSYADSIFPVGREFLNVVRERPTGRPLRLAAGIDQAVPKLVAREILKPVLHLPQSVHLVCREAAPDQLLSDLAGYRLDLVITDQPARHAGKTRVFNHLLGECGLKLMAAPSLAAKLRRNFPRSLHRAPALLPPDHTAMRRTLHRWFEAHNVEPLMAGDFDDSALMKVFGSEGFGFFAVPSLIADEIERQYLVEEIATLKGCTERFYAVTAERKIKHPAVVALTEAARTSLHHPA